jgi:hypothetical protein
MNGYLTHQANQERLEELRRQADEHRLTCRLPALQRVRPAAARNRWPLLRSVPPRP